MRPETRLLADDQRLALLDGLIYSDVFDCALTLEEMWRYARTPIGADALRRRLREDPSLRRIVIERKGLYCFADRPALIAQRPGGMHRARRLERRAGRVAKVLQSLPFVRGVVLTGSVAAEHAGDGADVDIMVAVAKSRLGTVFLMLGSVSRLFGRRLFCPNYYVCEGNFTSAPTSLYVARELAQARILIGDGTSLCSTNPLLAEVFPNAVAPAREPAGWRGATRLQQFVEMPLRGPLGERLERRARALAFTRLRAHYRGRGEEVPSEVLASFAAGRSLRFHGGRAEEATLRRYALRREQIAARLKTLDHEPKFAQPVASE
jgi:predicted nucleotidyltransferase